ncbi:coiled-coil domain-containing protein 87 isoform X2 [Ascaphus truei]|uniref:coiled-coil domain-containing protein 87 isoform X2 n=1 Tax=Ascaphus truei TaxID=8439 RepID=UPI003F59CDF8
MRFLSLLYNRTGGSTGYLHLFVHLQLLPDHASDAFIQTLEDIGSIDSQRSHRKLMYSMADKKLDVKKLHQLYNDILKPLTLFPSQIHTVAESKDPAHKTTATADRNILKEQVNESVCEDEDDTCSYPSFSDDWQKPSISPEVLCELVKRRLKTLNVDSVEVQQIFEEVILDEVKFTCDSIPHVTHTSLLSTSEQQQLYHRLISHIMIVSEELLMHYLHKMEWNKTQSIFSDGANLTRFKAQLLLDCSKFFNLFSVGHHLIAEIKKVKHKELVDRDPDEISEDRSLWLSEHADKKCTDLKNSKSYFTMAHFIKLGRPKAAVRKLQRDADLKQLENIQPLDLKKVYMLIPEQEDNSSFLNKMHCEAVTTPCPDLHSEDQKTKENNIYGRVTFLKTWCSCPNLREGERLADELGITSKPYASECPEICSTVETVVDGDFISDDLKRLMQDSTLQRLQGNNLSSDEEIPPLITALTHGRVNAAKLQKLESLLQDSNDMHGPLKETQTIETCLHPQAYSIDLRIPNKPLVRSADVRTSDRIFTDLMQISKYPPLYNDFSSEIEFDTVKRLDRNIFVGHDLKEVCTELVKNLSNDHLKFEQDVVHEPYARNVDFSKCVSSSTLTRRKNQRVINKDLNCLASSVKYDSVEQAIVYDEYTTRVRNAWLVWWKSAITTEDYMKYVSTQDLDYLKVVYHLYDSDFEDEELANLVRFKEQDQEQKKRERDKRIADFRAKKQDFVPGMWNINSVMLGGLGTDPILQDEEHEREDKTETSSRTTKSAISREHELQQERINAVWNTLHVPEGLRLDMAIKYSSNEYQDLLPEAIDLWEKVVKLIEKREQFLSELEMFEKVASDPNRFFQKGYAGTSMARMQESRERKQLHRQMTDIEHKILKVLRVIKKIFNDTVSFKGRPYVEKIQRDKIEMLYCLQQDRRKVLIERDIKKEIALLNLEPQLSNLL